MVRYILTHFRPHMDEVLAIWLLQNFGEEQFPGIQDAKIKFLRTGVLPAGETAESLLAQGILCIGVGGGDFDEHATKDKARKEGYAAATLVAEHLELENRSDLQQIKPIVDSVFRNDTTGSTTSQDDICIVIKKMLRVDQGLAIRFALDSFKAVYLQPGHSFSTKDLLKTLARPDYTNLCEQAKAKQAADWQAAKQEWKDSGQIVELAGPRGQLRVGIIKSDEPEIAGAIRHQHFGDADLAVIQKNFFQIQILARTSSQLYLYDLVKLLRDEEAYLAGEDFEITTHQPEKVDGAAGLWYFFVSPGNEHFQLILNGSETTPDVQATKISLDRIIELIRIALDWEYFPHSTCKDGICRHSNCTWHPAQLNKCFEIRKQGRRE